jgi:hypothetical protein
MGVILKTLFQYVWYDEMVRYHADLVKTIRTATMHSEESQETGVSMDPADPKSVNYPYRNVKYPQASSIEGSSWNGTLQHTWAVVKACGRPKVKHPLTTTYTPSIEGAAHVERFQLLDDHCAT